MTTYLKLAVGFVALNFLGELYNFASSDLVWAGAVVAFLVVVPFIARWAGVGGYRDLGLTRQDLWGARLRWGLFVGAWAGAVSWGLEWWLNGATIREWHLLPEVALPLVVASMLGSLVEETFFRGYLLRVLPERWPFWVTTLVGAAVFAAGPWHRWGVRPIDHFLFLFVMGIAFVVAFQRTGSLWLSWGLHAGHNIGVNLLANRSLVVVSEPASATWGAGHTDVLMAAVMALVVILVTRPRRAEA